MTTYYRRSNTSPMSDWGHAMFSDNLDHICNYGKRVYIFDGTDAVDILDSHDIIVAEWEKQAATGHLPIGYEDLDAETVFHSLNPVDIVDSADGWDNGEIVTWFGDTLGHLEIKAIITNDGAIVLDESVIKEVFEDGDEVAIFTDAQGVRYEYNFQTKEFLEV